jgi:metallo-beta-lactamase family protein
MACIPAIRPKNWKTLLKRSPNGAAAWVIQAFAVGRTQELLYTIRKLEDEGTIPAIPVHVDSPMGIEATKIYCRHTNEHDFEMAALRDEARSPISSRHMTCIKLPRSPRRLTN